VKKKIKIDSDEYIACSETVNDSSNNSADVKADTSAADTADNPLAALEARCKEADTGGV
jgi:hypothetical protein